jgi:hypothetical protein
MAFDKQLRTIPFDEMKLSRVLVISSRLSLKLQILTSQVMDHKLY